MKTPRPRLADRVARVDELLSYILLFAPAFPEDHETTVEEQVDRLLKALQELSGDLQDVERRRWLELAGQEVVEARACFLSGRPDDGRALIESARDHFNNWRKQKSKRPAFLVGPGGETERQ
jgi:hypothetical protein